MPEKHSNSTVRFDHGERTKRFTSDGELLSSGERKREMAEHQLKDKYRHHQQQLRMQHGCQKGRSGKNSSAQ